MNGLMIFDCELVSQSYKPLFFIRHLSIFVIISQFPLFFQFLNRLLFPFSNWIFILFLFFILRLELFPFSNWTFFPILKCFFLPLSNWNFFQFLKELLFTFSFLFYSILFFSFPLYSILFYLSPLLTFYYRISSDIFHLTFIRKPSESQQKIEICTCNLFSYHSKVNSGMKS